VAVLKKREGEKENYVPPIMIFFLFSIPYQYDTSMREGRKEVKKGQGEEGKARGKEGQEGKRGKNAKDGQALATPIIFVPWKEKGEGNIREGTERNDREEWDVESSKMR
jgi:hypothetical protein